MHKTVLIFTKPPRMGVSKTRLGHDIGPASAQRYNRFSIAQTFRAVADDRWQTRLYVAPERAVTSREPSWPSRVQRYSQGSGNLGDRLALGFRAAPRGQVLFIGTDAPDVTRPLIWQAFKGLQTSSAVFGPADDGGFWLFGLHRGARTVPPFEGVRWSTENAMADVIANLGDARIGYLPALVDLDDADSLKLWTRDRSQT